MTNSEATPKLKHSMEGAMAPKRPIRLLVKRLCIFFSLMYVIAMALWISGNFRSFLDSTQSLLLTVFAWDSILLSIFSLVGFISVVALPVPRERGGGMARSLLGLFGYLLLLAIGTLGAFFGDSVLTLAAGLR